MEEIVSEEVLFMWMSQSCSIYLGNSFYVVNIFIYILGR